MTDPASAFLTRKERKAIQRKLKRGEKPREMVPTIHGGRHGLLCSTRSRVLFAARRRLGVKVRAWPRSSIRGVASHKRRYGAVVLKTAKETLRFEMVQRGDAEAFMASMAPPQHARRRAPSGPARAGSPSRSAQARPAPRPPVRPKMAPEPEPEPDALAHRSSAEHRARLKGLLDRGIITKREYEWQVDSIKA